MSMGKRAKKRKKSTPLYCVSLKASVKKANTA